MEKYIISEEKAILSQLKQELRVLQKGEIIEKMFKSGFLVCYKHEGRTNPNFFNKLTISPLESEPKLQEFCQAVGYLACGLRFPSFVKFLFDTRPFDKLTAAFAIMNSRDIKLTSFIELIEKRLKTIREYTENSIDKKVFSERINYLYAIIKNE